MRTEGGSQNKDLQRIRAAAWAFDTRRVPVDAADHLLPLVGKPETGDLILAVVAYGNRYASNQFESEVPQTLGPCHLSAGGGIASRVTSWHARMKSPTQITPIGLLGNDRGGRINLRDYALPILANIGSQPPTTIDVVGTGMDSGKTAVEKQYHCGHFPTYRINLR
ncbi:MAG: hypothetical protein RL083_1272 [Pseudomonadota bacterium]|jgi:hypothetical protein